MAEDKLQEALQICGEMVALKKRLNKLGFKYAANAMGKPLFHIGSAMGKIIVKPLP